MVLGSARLYEEGAEGVFHALAGGFCVFGLGVLVGVDAEGGGGVGVAEDA